MPGGSLADQLDRARAAPWRWPWRARLAVLCDVAEGMAQMHGKRYVHRDLKPDNVLLSADGRRAKIADLGLARTHSEFNVERVASVEQRRGAAANANAAAMDLTWADAGGTPQYMAPRVIAEYLNAGGLAAVAPSGGDVAAALSRQRRSGGGGGGMG